MARPQRRIFIASAVCVLAASASGPIAPAFAQSDMTLQLRKQAFGTEASIDFAVSGVPAAAATDRPLDELTKDRRFQFTVDTDQVAWFRSCTCFRSYVILIRRAGAGAQVWQFKVRATPTGSFPDQWLRVPFDVEEDGVTDEGEARLPLAGAQPLDAMEEIRAAAPTPVYLHGVSTITVDVKNTSDTDISLEPLPELAVDDRVWKRPHTLRDGGKPIIVRPGATTRIAYNVEPRLESSINLSFFRLRPNEEHTAVSLEIPYRNSFIQERTGQLQATVSLRFRPHLIVLAAGLFAGVLLGSALRLVGRARRASWRVWARTTGQAALAAVVVECIAMFLVAMGSQFVFFTFELDPWQTFPTTIIGLVCGVMGEESIGAARRLLKLDEQKAEPRAESTAQPAVTG